MKLLDTPANNFIDEENEEVDIRLFIRDLWDRRNEDGYIRTATHYMVPFLNHKETIEKVEFYLPQLVHMMIQAEIDDIDDKALISFGCIVAATNMHAGMMMCLNFIAAMEDYQPELPSGLTNEASNPRLFGRCALLLEEIEHSIVFQNTYDAMHIVNRATIHAASFAAAGVRDTEEEGSPPRSVVNDDNSELDLADVFADNLGEGLLLREVEDEDDHLRGWLGYKRRNRKHCLSTKGWIDRFFKVENRVLLCYKDQKMKVLKRAIPLEGTNFTPINSPKPGREFCFEIFSGGSDIIFSLKCKNLKHMVSWMEYLIRMSKAPIQGKYFLNNGEERQAASHHSLETSSSDVPIHPADINLVAIKREKGFTETGVGRKFTELMTRATHAVEAKWKEMPPESRQRLEFLRAQLKFIRDITDICERMRYVPIPERREGLKKELEKLTVPRSAYNPLRGSLCHWERLLCTMPRDGYAFRTRARCPVLFRFETCGDFSSTETDQGSNEDDVATVMRTKLFAKHLFLEGTTDVHSKEYSELRPMYNDEGSAETKSGNNTDETLPLTLSTRTLTEQTEMRRWSTFSEAVETATQYKLGINFKDQPLKNEGNGSPVKDAKSLVQSDNDDSLGRGEYADEIFGELTSQRRVRIQDESKYSKIVKNWNIDGFIAKSNDDLRQETFVIQMITFYQRLFAAENCPVWLKSYNIMSTSKTTGMIGLITDSQSIDGCKKSEQWPGTMRLHFEKMFGTASSPGSPLDKAITNFVRSMAGYSIVSYLLWIKDRHNGNIMLDRMGHILHIDFGFVFGLAPGKAFSMERAPWKLTKEYIDVMGGEQSNYFAEYRKLCIQAMRLARAHADAALGIVALMTHNSVFPAFQYNKNALEDFRARLLINVPDESIENKVDELITISRGHSGTKNYDKFQTWSNEIAR
jgi:hypothetical protein